MPRNNSPRVGRFGREDLGIDGHGLMPQMHQMEQQDCAAVLDDWINRVANLPAEIAFMQEEIAAKDKVMQGHLSTIARCDNSIQKWIRVNGSQQPNPKEEQLSRIIKENYDQAQIIQQEKLALTTKTQLIIDKHTRHLDKQIKALQDRGEFPTDPDIPSLLRPQTNERAARVEPSAAEMPLSSISNPAGVHMRQPNQHPIRSLPAQVQTHHMTGGSASAPATPAAAILLQQRQAREASLGAAAIKRQKLTAGVVLPSGNSLARHSSLTPGTPRAGTPSGGRAGSVPRTQKGAATKKVAPRGSAQSGLPRKSKPGKSSLSRVKRTGNKNSPSSTNDSDLSEAETGSAGEDDEAVTPPATKDGDGDDDMVDIDDDEGGDDKKYCTCQSVSYGDMVACDNESCPFEWFHWSCVGLKSEPVGTWICPVCTKNMKK